MYGLLLLSILIALVAQINVKSTFSKYNDVKNSRGVTGAQAARDILDANGLYNVGVQRISGKLTDHYDPAANVIRLSDSVYSSSSVAAVGIAAHEAGHAVQHAEDWSLIRIRSRVVPAANFGSSLSVPLVILGAVFSIRPLVNIGIILFFIVVLFHLVTLPVEFNASSRAMKTLRNNAVLDEDELDKTKKVLGAAALTYVAALLVSVVQLFRLIAISRRN
ncbi:MAG: zinc metallopeptidase [Oscillospiraceae bacterium]|nr:zinc metallopeptidase [Oscillospiraceae bacterium]